MGSDIGILFYDRTELEIKKKRNEIKVIAAEGAFNRKMKQAIKVIPI